MYKAVSGEMRYKRSGPRPGQSNLPTKTFTCCNCVSLVLLTVLNRGDYAKTRRGLLGAAEHLRHDCRGCAGRCRNTRTWPWKVLEGRQELGVAGFERALRGGFKLVTLLCQMDDYVNSYCQMRCHFVSLRCTKRRDTLQALLACLALLVRSCHNFLLGITRTRY